MVAKHNVVLGSYETERGKVTKTLKNSWDGSETKYTVEIVLRDIMANIEIIYARI